MLDYLKILNPLFEDVRYYDDIHEDGWRGITDEYLNYAYIRNVRDKEAVQFRLESKGNDYGCHSYEVIGDFYLVSGFEACVDRGIAVKILINQISDFEENGVRVTVFEVGTQTDMIYKEETGSDDWKLVDRELLRIGFTMIKVISASGTTLSLCREVCCG